MIRGEKYIVKSKKRGKRLFLSLLVLAIAIFAYVFYPRFLVWYRDGSDNSAEASHFFSQIDDRILTELSRKEENWSDTQEKIRKYQANQTKNPNSLLMLGHLHQSFIPLQMKANLVKLISLQIGSTLSQLEWQRLEQAESYLLLARSLVETKDHALYNLLLSRNYLYRNNQAIVNSPWYQELLLHSKSPEQLQLFFANQAPESKQLMLLMQMKLGQSQWMEMAIGTNQKKVIALDEQIRLLILSFTYLRQQQPTQALKYASILVNNIDATNRLFTIFAPTDSRHPPTEINLEQWIVNLYIYCAIADKQYDKATQLLNHIRQINSPALSHYLWGLLMMAQNQNESAIIAFKQALATDGRLLAAKHLLNNLQH